MELKYHNLAQTFLDRNSAEAFVLACESNETWKMDAVKTFHDSFHLDFVLTLRKRLNTNNLINIFVVVKTSDGFKIRTLQKELDLAEDQLEGYMEAAVKDGFMKDKVQHVPVVATGTVLIGIGPLLLHNSLTDDNTTLPFKMENLSING
jgi:hypothetical protein